MLLWEYLYEWLEVVKESTEENTYITYKSIIKNHINPYLGDVKLNKLNSQIIQQYYKILNDQRISKTQNINIYDDKVIKDNKINNCNMRYLSGTSVKLIMTILSAELNYAKRQGYNENNPCKKVKLRKISKKEVGIFSD